MKKRCLIGRTSAVLISIAMAFSTMVVTPQIQVNAETAVSVATATQQLEDIFTTIDLMDATIADLQAEMTAGHVTAEQLTQMYIDRIKAYDEKLKLNSIISINPAALEDAATLDAERQEGNVRGPLHGIPIVVKANYDVAGMATSAGSNALADMIAPEDSFVVKQLREAGAVILAQANMSEFAYSASDSKSTLGGMVHNAYDMSKSSAGSSGGTAVAVTCNFAAAGLGTDTGGSIRNPSSFSNLYGIRPSKGITSISGVVPLLASRDTTGPIARTAEDMALILETMAGTDPKDDFTVEADADALVGDGYMDSLSKDSLKGMRIGYLDYSFFYPYAEYPENEETGEDETGNEETGNEETGNEETGSEETGNEETGNEETGNDEIGNNETEDGGEEYPGYEIKTRYPDEKIRAMLNRTLANLRKAGAEIVDLSGILPADVYYGYYFGATGDTMEYDLNKYLYEKGDAATYKTMKDILKSGKDISYTYLNQGINDPNVLADSFEETENPYTTEIDSFMRLDTWETALEGRAYITEVLAENDIDAVMYLPYYNAVPDLPIIDNWDANGVGYDFIFGPAMGLPEISMPMGFSDADGEYTSEMPLGLYLFSGFGNEETLMQIAYSYEQQAGENIRRMPESTPALPDANLNAYLEDLMDKVYSIDYSMYNTKPEGKVHLMLNAYDQAKTVNTKDPYAVYDSAKALARTYDNVIAALTASGVNPDWAGHRYEKLSWNWTDVTSASVTFTCLDDSSHTKTVAAEVTAKVAKTATYSAPGQKIYTAKVTLDGKTYTSSRSQTIYVYQNEWVNNIWYNKDGSQTYAPKMSWKRNQTGWWLQDTSGWYPRNRWQKVDGEWYYFNSKGYMAAGEWVDGYWLSKNGAWTYKKKAEWKRYGNKWMYRTSDWIAKKGKQKIDGTWYYFDLDGYLVPNQ